MLIIELDRNQMVDSLLIREGQKDVEIKLNYGLLFIITLRYDVTAPRDTTTLEHKFTILYLLKIKNFN